MRPRASTSPNNAKVTKIGGNATMSAEAATRPGVRFGRRRSMRRKVPYVPPTMAQLAIKGSLHQRGMEKTPGLWRTCVAPPNSVWLDAASADKYAPKKLTDTYNR